MSNEAISIPELCVAYSKSFDPGSDKFRCQKMIARLASTHDRFDLDRAEIIRGVGQQLTDWLKKGEVDFASGSPHVIHKMVEDITDSAEYIQATPLMKRIALRNIRSSLSKSKVSLSVRKMTNRVCELINSILYRGLEFKGRRPGELSEKFRDDIRMARDEIVKFENNECIKVTVGSLVEVAKTETDASVVDFLNKVIEEEKLLKEVKEIG